MEYDSVWLGKIAVGNAMCCNVTDMVGREQLTTSSAKYLYFQWLSPPT